MLLRCISIQSEPYSLQSKLITTLYLFLVSQLRKKVRPYTVYRHEHGRNISERIVLTLQSLCIYFIYYTYSMMDIHLNGLKCYILK